MKNALIIGIMISSWFLIGCALLAEMPYEAKLCTAVAGLAGVISSALLTFVEDYWR